MISNTFGDMARHLMLGRHSAHLKASITVLSTEMTTGIAADKTRHLQGDFTLLASLEKSLDLSTLRKAVAQNAGQILAAQQSTVGEIRARSEGLYAQLLQTELATHDGQRSLMISTLESLFVDSVALLNTRFAGRSLFAGTSGEGPAIASADKILESLVTDLPPVLDPLSLSDHIDSWFAEGGGFDSAAYLGGAPIPAAFALGEGIGVRIDSTAQAVPLRQTLAGLAKGALLARGIFDGNPAQQAATFSTAATTLATALDGLVALSAGIGIEEEKAVRAISRAEAEQTAMSIARAELLSVDPYESATKLEHAMSQLDLIYNLTARLSRLTLADYLR